MHSLPRFFLALILVSISVSWPFVSSGNDLDRIRVRGLGAVAGLVDQYAREYMRINPNCSIVVSGGSESRLEELLKGDCEIAMHTPWISNDFRKRARGKGLEIEGAIIGWGGLAIIVNKQNRLDAMLLQDLKKIYTGASTRWSDFNGQDATIKPFLISGRYSAAPEYVRRHILNSEFSANLKSRISHESVISAVASDLHSIGIIRFSDIGLVEQPNYSNRVKVLPIMEHLGSKPVPPSKESIHEGSYPLTRPYYIYMISGRKTKTLDDFMTFCALKNPRPLVIIEEQGSRIAVCSASQP